MIKEKYGVEYLLRQLAEECCELAQASLRKSIDILDRLPFWRPVFFLL
jgi:hypothetical protein